eukprot:TRINITY_DN9589_c0_g1_i1.p2 TRINITY_DN9589_c0_g1~~TRINITY_DN9589_c0_g1_i1.p2  ORF type:complete len:101 (+),score=37.62 TRINITY_DN9589_c0_g1_i1:539-841(+)
MEAVFKSPPHKRDLSFERVAEAAQVSLDQVEHLVMRALALGLVRGTLDQVGQVAKLNWVQPRVLDLAQIATMAQRFGEWCKTVDNTSAAMANQAPQLFVQ